MDKNKGRPTSLPVESTGKCKLGYSLEKLFFWCFKPQLLSGSTVDFLLYTCNLFIGKIIEVGVRWDILSDEFVCIFYRSLLP